MNLQLIDPFRRHIPDRIDSTLTVPRALHPLMPSSDASGIDGNDEDEANQIEKKKRSDTDGDDDVIQSKSTEGEDEVDENTKNQDKGRDTTTVEETKPKRRKKDTGKHEEDEEEDQYWTACYTVSFNRRGTALASAHASGLVPIHDFLSRTTSALYWPPPPISLNESETCASLSMENGLQFSGTFFERGQKRKATKSHEEGRVDGASNEQLTYVNGVTSLSWDRHNKTILAGAIGDYNLRLMDNTHPQVSLDCAEAAKREHNGSAILTVEDKSVHPSLSLESHVYASFQKSKGEAVVGLKLQTSSWGRGRLLRGNVLSSSHAHQNQCASSSAVLSSLPPPECSTTTTVQCMRHPTLILELPQPLGGPAQLHPHDSSTGLACLHDGSLVLFRLPPIAFYETRPASPGGDNDSTNDVETLEMLKREESKRTGNIDPPRSKDDSSSSYFITCAAFGQSGTEIYAATKCGTLLAFRIPTSMINMLRDEHNADLATNLASKQIKPSVCVKVPGAAAAWQIIVSRNGKHVLINSADCALRLYDVEEIFKNESETDPIHVSPRFVFQDTLSRSPWASCDFSADNEYVVGGCSSYSQSGNYNLFIWNAVTGELVDQLKGPQASLYSLSCHPTRSFIAVGTSDGVIDIWGPRVQWTAFAPDFQARQANVLYEEKEDEFDIVVDSNEGNVASESKGPPEEGFVDIINVEKTADSEDENEVFQEVRVLKIFSEKSKPKSSEM